MLYSVMLSVTKESGSAPCSIFPVQHPRADIAWVCQVLYICAPVRLGGGLISYIGYLIGLELVAWTASKGILVSCPFPCSCPAFGVRGVVCYYFLLYDFLVANLNVDSGCFTGCN